MISNLRHNGFDNVKKCWAALPIDARWQNTKLVMPPNTLLTIRAARRRSPRSVFVKWDPEEFGSCRGPHV
jgi:hypothetical protein